MYIAYLDETGDDGFPEYSSRIFVLTAFYLHHQTWRESFERIHAFRKQLKSDFDFPVRMEMHTKKFLLNKNPYRALSLSDEDRVAIVGLFAEMIAGMDIRIINVAILKGNVTSSSYPVLDNALTYLVQRIENDLSRVDPTKRFMIISDPGRIGKMRRTTRRVQRINFIPSKLHTGSYRKEIRSLIEDPLQKDSRESYFIQAADLVSFIAYYYARTLTKESFSNRMPPLVTVECIRQWLETLKPVLNLEATRSDEFGVVMYPK